MRVAVVGAGMVCTDSTKGPSGRGIGLAELAPPAPLAPRLSPFGAPGLVSAKQERSTSSFLQRCLLVGYKVVSLTGVFSTRVGRGCFLAAYEGYKSIWDTAHLKVLATLVKPGTTVVDVGANVGFYTRRFAEWVRPGGEVIAIEPEEVNFATLKRVMGRRGLVNVLPVQAVAAESAGKLRLEKNPFHPADHRIGDATSVAANRNCVDVEAVTIDGVLRERGWPAVSLMKIDVQGAEERVLKGAMETLGQLRPAVFMEVDDAALRAMASSAESVLNLMFSCRYEAYRIGGHGACRVSKGEALRVCQQGSYVDLLFRPVE